MLRKRRVDLGDCWTTAKAATAWQKSCPLKENPYLILLAAKTIKAGEELLYDYGERSKDILESHPWLKSWDKLHVRVPDHRCVCFKTGALSLEKYNM